MLRAVTPRGYAFGCALNDIGVSDLLVPVDAEENRGNGRINESKFAFAFRRSRQ